MAGDRHSLIFVARQLGHRSITTTDEYYGHLKTTLFKEATALTEAMIAAANAARHNR